MSDGSRLRATSARSRRKEAAERSGASTNWSSNTDEVDEQGGSFLDSEFSFFHHFSMVLTSSIIVFSEQEVELNIRVKDHGDEEPPQTGKKGRIGGLFKVNFNIIFC